MSVIIKENEYRNDHHAEVHKLIRVTGDKRMATGIVPEKYWSALILASHGDRMKFELEAERTPSGPFWTLIQVEKGRRFTHGKFSPTDDMWDRIGTAIDTIRKTQEQENGYPFKVENDTEGIVTIEKQTEDLVDKDEYSIRIRGEPVIFRTEVTVNPQTTEAVRFTKTGNNILVHFDNSDGSASDYYIPLKKENGRYQLHRGSPNIDDEEGVGL